MAEGRNITGGKGTAAVSRKYPVKDDTIRTEGKTMNLFPAEEGSLVPKRKKVGID